jgi:hypothetical protein
MVNTCVIADTTIGASINENRVLRSWEHIVSYRRCEMVYAWVYAVGTVVTEGTALMVCSGALGIALARLWELASKALSGEPRPVENPA